MIRIPRFAKMGSTKLDILSKMYDELMSDKQINTIYQVLGNYKNFASIPASYYNALVEHYIYKRCAYNSSVPAHKDLSKVDFDFENHEVDEADPDLATHRKLPDGTEIIWCWAGGDWESSVSFVFYLDPNDKIRAYIPRKVIAIVQSVTPLGVLVNVEHRNQQILMLIMC